MVLLFCILLHLAESLTLFTGATMEWTVTGESVEFEITFTESALNGYDWVGIGFQDGSKTSSLMAGADLYTIVISTWEITDQHRDGSSNGTPSDDASQDVVLGHTDNGDSDTVTITRQLDTADSDDFSLTVGTEYLVLHARGTMSGSTVNVHSTRDSVSFTLTESSTTDDSGDTGSEDTGSEDTGSEDTGSGDTDGGDTDTGDADGGDTGSGETEEEGDGEEGSFDGSVVLIPLFLWWVV